MSDPLLAIGSLDSCECFTQISVTLKINGKKYFTLKNNIGDITKVLILLFWEMTFHNYKEISSVPSDMQTSTCEVREKME